MEITIIQNIDKNISMEITEHPPILPSQWLHDPQDFYMLQQVT